MSDCKRCGGRANDAFLCRNCQTTLQTALADLPWFLNRLTETALGHTRMADNAGRKSAARKDLDGDAELASCIELLPQDDDLDKARAKREKAALAHALATGGINARASELLAEISDSLSYWCRVLCESRGVDYAPANAMKAHGANHAAWLSIHVASIAAYEGADDIAGDIDTHLEDIVKVVNRPIRWWALGPCPGWFEDRRTHTSEECKTELRVPAHTEEVQCHRCRTRHNVHRLAWARKVEKENTLMSGKDLIRYNKELPAEFQVSPRTLQHWLATGRLCACGELAGDPLYSWIDVQLLAVKRVQKSATGAAAHHRNG
jgi:hypothetical protein